MLVKGDTRSLRNRSCKLPHTIPIKDCDWAPRGGGEGGGAGVYPSSTHEIRRVLLGGSKV